MENQHENGLVRTQGYVNGEWVRASSGKTFEVSNPATAFVSTVRTRPAG